MPRNTYYSESGDGGYFANGDLSCGPQAGRLRQRGDYVCRYNVLNCPVDINAKSNTPPQYGKTYLVQNGDKMEKVIYRGCTVPNFKNFISLNGIKYSKEFYGSDYAVMNPSQPEYYSTIYWNHLVKVDPENKTELEFYTSDITGQFKIVVQGVTKNDVVYGENEFNVLK